MAIGPAVDIAIDRMEFSGGQPLFSHLRLTVAPGEVLALIGSSGVGKTTILRIIGGVEKQFAGIATVGGIPAGQAPVPGFVFQDARLLPWLTVGESIQAVSPGLSADLIDAMLAQVGLAGLALAYPRQLSGGMQRRLGLARAISVNPRLLLLDEPFVSLDRTVVQELQALFRSLFVARRPTVILVSHDAEDAARLADRVVILSGRPARITADLRLTDGDENPGGLRSAVSVARLVARIEEAEHGALG